MRFLMYAEDDDGGPVLRELVPEDAAVVLVFEDDSDRDFFNTFLQNAPAVGKAVLSFGDLAERAMRHIENGGQEIR